MEKLPTKQTLTTLHEKDLIKLKKINPSNSKVRKFIRIQMDVTTHVLFVLFLNAEEKVLVKA